ncbi:TPA: hypothetical protein ACSTJZ_003160 [Serratia fonticola]
MKKLWRWWKIRELKQLWWEEICLREIAKQRNWQSVLDCHHIEHRYHFIKRLSKELSGVAA